MPEPAGSTPPIRPRGKPAVRPHTAPAPINGAEPMVPERLRRLTRAVEELRAAAIENRLPPMRIDWQRPPRRGAAPEPADAERAALQAHISTFLADHEGYRPGPYATPLNELAAPTEPDAYLVGNLIRPGTTVMLAGPPGAAKSWLSRQLALCCGAGLPIFLERYEIARPLRVLVVDEDNGPDEEWRRDERLLAHLGLQRSALGSVRRISLADVKLDTERWQRWLRGAIRTHDYDLVILDPASELHAGKELREDPAFAALIAFLKRLRIDFPRTAVVLVHHTRKLPASERQAHRGLEDVRGQWGQTPDVIVIVSPLGERRVKWEVHKRVPHSSLILEQLPEGQPGEGALRMVADETVMRSKAAETDDKVLNAIEAGARTAEEIRIGTGLSQSAVYKVTKRLARAGLITKRTPFELLIDPTEDPL